MVVNVFDDVVEQTGGDGLRRLTSYRQEVSDGEADG